MKKKRKTDLKQRHIKTFCRCICFLLISVPVISNAQPSSEELRSTLGFTDEELKVYFSNWEEIDKWAKISANDVLFGMQDEYIVANVSRKVIALSLWNQERRKICYNYIYPKDHLKRIAAKRAVEEDYHFRLDSALLLANDISGINTTKVLRKGYAFSLSPAQYDSLMVRAVAMRQYLQKHPKEDVYRQDVEALRDILSEKQFDSYFSIKHSSAASARMNEIWSVLKESSFADRVDSTYDCPRIYHYVLKRLKAEDVYGYDPQLRNDAISKVDASVPEAVRFYNYILKKRNIETKLEGPKVHLQY